MATTVLSKTFGTATNRKKWTMSVWLKKAFPISEGTIFSSYSTGTTSNYSAFRDNGDTTYEFVENDGSYTINLRPSLKLRDTAAWYHLVLAYDSTQSVAADRVNYYVNGVLQTAWGTETYPTLNQESGINQAALHTIGKNTATDNSYFNGVMAHFHFIDGLQYAASDFGETDSTSGIWVAKTGPSVTYGNNGFFLKFQDTAAFGDDSSGNTNDFALSGTMTQTKDTPDNNFSTVNPLNNPNSDMSWSNGNTTVTNSGQWRGVTSSLGMPSGKWYTEFKITGTNAQTGGVYGIGKAGVSTSTSNMESANNGYSSKYAYGYERWMGSTSKTNNNSSTAGYGTIMAENDIGMIAFDADNGTVWTGVNGTWDNSATSGEIAAGTTTNAMFSSIVMDDAFFFTFSIEGTAVTPYINCNFGNGYFGTTIVTSAGTSSTDDDSIWEYDCPTGFYGLNTINLGSYS